LIFLLKDMVRIAALRRSRRHAPSPRRSRSPSDEEESEGADAGAKQVDDSSSAKPTNIEDKFEKAMDMLMKLTSEVAALKKGVSKKKATVERSSGSRSRSSAAGSGSRSGKSGDDAVDVDDEDDAVLRSLPEQMRELQKYCASTQCPVYEGGAGDAVEFFGRLHFAFASFNLTEMLQPPHQRATELPEAVRVGRNAMAMLLLKAAYVRFPDKLVIDLEPERAVPPFPSSARAWYVFGYLSQTSSIMSPAEGTAALRGFVNLTQGNGVHSFFSFPSRLQCVSADFDGCSRRGYS
jgi:hypothetical protein